MDNKMDHRALAIKLGELYESCLIRENAQTVLKQGWGSYASQQYYDDSSRLEKLKKELHYHQESYEQSKPKPKSAEEQSKRKYESKEEIEQERQRAIVAHERPYYMKWMILTVIVTALCCLAACVLSVQTILKQDNPFGAANICLYIIASAIVVYSYMFADPRSKACSNANAKPTSILPLLTFAILAFLFMQWRMYLVFAVALVNLILNAILMNQPSKAVKKTPQCKALYSATDYATSHDLQKKIDAATKSAENTYQAELDAYNRQYQSKLSKLQQEIGQLEKAQKKGELEAKEKLRVEREQTEKQIAPANRIFEQADFLQDEDKTSECVWFLYQELSSGRASSLKQALIAYDEYKANNRDTLARLDIITNISNRSANVYQKAKEDEKRLQQMRAQNAALAREIREQESRIQREIRNK